MVADGRGNYFPILAPSDDEAGLIHCVYDIFRFHSESRIHTAELRRFIENAKRHKTFLDIGCSHGFMSALFLAVNGPGSRIHSVDCVGSQPMLWEHLLMTRRQNLSQYPEAEWTTAKRYVTSTANRDDPEFNCGFALSPDCLKVSLPDILSDCTFRPEFIKFDIEGSEYDILCDRESVRALKDLQAVLQIELHNEFLPKGAGKEIANHLTSAGFEMTHATSRRWDKVPNCHIYFAPA